jgi:ABC-type Fe3+-siderophore transport system permease subunit
MVSVSFDDTRGELRFEADGRRRIVLTTTALVVLLVLVALISLTGGAVSVPGGRVADILVHAIEARGVDPTQDALVVTYIRLPRLFLGMMIGAALAMSGALMLGLFRNPLADPSLAGVSAGAGLGAALAIVLSDRLPAGLAGLPSLSLLPAAAFLGGLRRHLESLRDRHARGPHVGRDDAARWRGACGSGEFLHRRPCLSER